jgi:single-strand DNA-binding protein
MGYNYNHVTLIGRLTKDPEHKAVKEDRGKTLFTVAVNRPYRKDDGTTDADFIPVVLWGKLGEVSMQLLGKGKPVLVWGQLQIRNYEKDNEHHSYTEVVGEGFQLLDKVVKGEEILGA